MSLNIKNEHVHRLAREAARRTGRTQTSAIELALEQLLARLDSQADRVDALLAGLQRDIAAKGGLREDDLYDDNGLPK